MAIRLKIVLEETEVFPAIWHTVRAEHFGIPDNVADRVYLALVTVFRSILQLI